MCSLLRSREIITKMEICSYWVGRSSVNSLIGYYALFGGWLTGDSVSGSLEAEREESV